MADTTQSDFAFNPPMGAPGEYADYASHSNAINESYTGSVALPFGRGVSSAAATPNVCELPVSAGTAARFAGIVLKNQSKPTGAGYAIGEQVLLARTGRVRVVFETAMADKAQPFIRITESAVGANDMGQFRNDVDGGKAVACPGCMVRAVNGVVAAAGVGVLELNLEGVKI
jgi:hypothetical protein